MAKYQINNMISFYDYFRNINPVEPPEKEKGEAFL